MVRFKEKENAVAKTASLLTAIVVLLMSFALVPDWSLVGVARDCSWTPRLVYSFFHASPLHALVNAWCLLSIVFIYGVSIWRLLAAYLVALMVPALVLSEVPTVGLSCICYFLLGSLILEVNRKLYFVACTVLYIALGFLFPFVNALIHVYGYLAGLSVGLFNAPLSCFHMK